MEPILTNEQETSLINALKKGIQTYSYKENFDHPFLLASGEYSPFYVDLKQTLLNPEYLLITAQLVLNHIIKTMGFVPTALSGLTMGADPIIYAISFLAQANNITTYPLIVRKEAKNHGSKKRIEGLYEQTISKDNCSIVLIDDVITTGMSTLKAFNAFTEINSYVVPQHAFCIIDRLQGGKENLLKHNITIHSLFTITDFKK